MANNKVPGSIVGLTIGGVWLKCQVEATLNFTVNVTEEDPCKPEPGDPVIGDIPWVERSAESREWNIDYSTNLLRNSLNASNPNIGKMIIDGNVEAEIQFMTREGQTKSDVDFLYAGSGILTGFSLAAPVTGNVTSDGSIAGNGPMTYTEIPVVVTP